jgi:undecaprenyl-phosphate 4-deoxy-4-formamido-L-arabinose transferase
MPPPHLSVVIPVYNEEEGLAALFARLYPALDALGLAYEVIFVDDGSRDRSAAILREQFDERPQSTRVVLLAGNFGQHPAILAGFAHCRGERVVTLDADLQNPPEEIGKLLARMDQGADYVGGVRSRRQDSLLRRVPSRLMNRLRERITSIRMTDQGCMLRAYSREVIDALNRCRETNTFIPALAYTFARNPAEIEVAHEERAAGISKYSMLKLVRLNFDLMTGFSIAPLQFFSVLGMLIAAGSVLLYLFVMAERMLLAGSLREALAALWDRDILAYFLIGLQLFGVGLLGEYVGRIYEEVRQRPRYVVSAVLQREE